MVTRDCVITSRYLTRLKTRGIDRCSYQFCKNPELKLGDQVVSHGGFNSLAVDHSECWEKRFIG